MCAWSNDFMAVIAIFGRKKFLVKVQAKSFPIPNECNEKSDHKRTSSLQCNYIRNKARFYIFDRENLKLKKQNKNKKNP